MNARLQTTVVDPADVAADALHVCPIASAFGFAGPLMTAAHMKSIWPSHRSVT
jgi:hypothetical protein